MYVMVCVYVCMYKGGVQGWGYVMVCVYVYMYKGV
jgi:hypothetical protein